MLKKLFKGKKKENPSTPVENAAFSITKNGPVYQKQQEGVNGEDSPNQLLKVVFTGTTNTGKSCLVSGKIAQKFQPTIGVEFSVITVKVMCGQNKFTKVSSNSQTINFEGEDLGQNMDKTITIQMWDTAGLNKFKSIVKSFYRGGNVIVFVYSVDNRESFQEAVMIYEDMMKHKDIHPQAKAVVIANKNDLERVVSSEEGIEFARRLNGIQHPLGYGYYEVSCKLDPMVIAHSICLDFYRIQKDENVRTLLDLYSAGPQEEKKEKSYEGVLQNSYYDDKYDFLLKFCLVGPQNCGKSSILMRFVEGQFNQGYIPTIGVDFKIKKIQSNGSIAKLQLWDTSNQYGGIKLYKAYMKSARVIMYVYDCTKPETLERIKDSFIPLVMENIDNDVFHYNIIVANKCGESLGPFVNENIERGRALANVNGWGFAQVSAAKNQGIHDLFELCTDYLLKNDASLKI